MILRRYINTQVAVTTALVLGFLVVVLLGGRLIRYFGIAAEGGLDVGVLFTLIGYNLPYFLELILPLSFFIGLMLVFGKLYADSEMAVLNASGVSRGKMSRFLVPLIVLMFAFESFITLVGKPWGVASATNIWQEQASIEVFNLIRPKEFISAGDYHLYVGEIGENREFLKDVIVIQMQDSQNKALPTNQQTNQLIDTGQIPKELVSDKDTLIYAKSAVQVPSESGITLDLLEGRRYEVDTASKKYSQVGFGRYRINLAGKSSNEAKPMKIEGVPTQDLPARMTNGDTQAMAEMGYRLSLPFLMILAVMLATPLATVRPRQGRWLKLIPSIFIFVANALIIIALKETIGKGKVGLWVYPVVLAVCFAFAIYLNYHERLMSKSRLNKTERAA